MEAMGDIKTAEELGYQGHSQYRMSVCQSCGQERWVRLLDYNRGKCAYVVRNTKTGELHPNWKGGRYNHRDGYIIVQLLPDSPYYSMAHERGCVLEHRLVMAQSLGRCLLYSEVVHHIDGNKQNNDITNLELLPNNGSHLPYIYLQQKVAEMEKQIRLLTWRIKQLEHGNPVPRREDGHILSDVRRDYTGGTLDV